MIYLRHDVPPVTSRIVRVLTPFHVLDQSLPWSLRDAKQLILFAPESLTARENLFRAQVCVIGHRLSLN